jgi:hypothetical protein
MNVFSPSLFFFSKTSVAGKLVCLNGGVVSLFYHRQLLRVCRHGR